MFVGRLARYCVVNDPFQLCKRGVSLQIAVAGGSVSSMEPSCSAKLCGYLLNWQRSTTCSNGALRQKPSSSESAEERVNDIVTEQKDASKDRTREIPVETSIKYLDSKAYSQTYGNDPVWVNYRRNHKGMFAPRKTRKTCIRQGVISTGNPCPICRDEYLVLHHKNINLLKQFISPHNGEILSFMKTGLCQKRHAELLVAVEKARDYGFLTFDVPLRTYDYSHYYKS